MLSDRTLSKLQGMRKCSINGHRVKDLFQMILNAPDLWEQAYGNIYANKGGMTPGVDGRTIDGYSDERAANLRELLRENRYVPTPVQRVYIPKPNGKLRPLGMPMYPAYCISCTRVLGIVIAEPGPLRQPRWAQAASLITVTSEVPYRCCLTADELCLLSPHSAYSAMRGPRC